MMQSSELPRPPRKPLTAAQKIELIAKLERSPDQAKALAKEVGIGEITLHSWRTAFIAGEELVDDPLPVTTPAGHGRAYSYNLRLAVAQAYLHKEGTAEQLARRFGIASHSSVTDWARQYQQGELQPEPELPRHRDPNRQYSEEERKAAVADYLRSRQGYAMVAERHGLRDSNVLFQWVQESGLKGASKLDKKRKYTDAQRAAALADLAKTGEAVAVVARRHDVNEKTMWTWAIRQNATPTKEVPAMPAERRRFPDEFRYDVAKAVMNGELTAADASRKYEVHASLVSGWIKLVKTKKLKPPKGKPGPKPKANGAAEPPVEVVQEYRPRQTTLALPTPAQLTRVTTVDEELARKDAEIARLKRLLAQTQAMLLHNGE